MENIIRIYDFIGSEGRSRVNASKLHIEDLPCDSAIVLDCSNVNFLSRSFTDEVISQLDKRTFRLENANSIIKNMFKAVENGRSKPRRHSDDGAVMLHFDNMADLSRYLNSSL